MKKQLTRNDLDDPKIFSKLLERDIDDARFNLIKAIARFISGLSIWLLVIQAIGQSNQIHIEKTSAVVLIVVNLILPIIWGITANYIRYNIDSKINKLLIILSISSIVVLIITVFQLLT